MSQNPLDALKERLEERSAVELKMTISQIARDAIACARAYRVLAIQANSGEYAWPQDMVDSEAEEILKNGGGK